MNTLYQPLTQCLLCRSPHMELVVPLEPIPIATPNFSVAGLSDEEIANAYKGVPLGLHLCQECGHVQVGQVGNPEFQYRDYIYTTSLSPGLTEHFRDHAERILKAFPIAADSLVVDIGSNDGTLLRFFQNHGMRVLGIDPARKIAEAATASGVETIGEFFSLTLAKSITGRVGKASIVIANNMIANVHDLVDFVEGVGELLAPHGVFVFETQYGADIIERTLLDTVYHEHLSYFFVKPTCAHFARHGMEVVNVERIEAKGGSIRVTVQRKGGPHNVSEVVREMCDYEDLHGMTYPAFFQILTENIRTIRDQLRLIVTAQRSAGKGIAGFGVAVGTTTLLAQFGLIHEIDFLLDDDPNKAVALSGPGYSIPVLATSVLLERMPGATIVFAWRYADAISRRHNEYLKRGGRFIIPLPTVREIQ